ncbi:hypothetical protein RHGRI_002768 [Rhododendron griersonianum]|uniref:Uncharacterized protein n=1 Tax=Rhododendron griersonianum TaxID=479676 RepID=A0AAV6LQ96_9ERIC|nr:hypothetical protein RHGRI_002768 [Rhododendron griersonianum]
MLANQGWRLLVGEDSLFFKVFKAESFPSCTFLEAQPRQAASWAWQSILASKEVMEKVKEILKLCPARVLVSLYKLPSFDSVDDFLQKVATVRGKLKKGGIVDVKSTARIVLHTGMKDDVKQQPSNQGNDLVNDGDDEPMGSEEDVAAAKVKAENAGRRQNEKLYDAVGILDTKLMTAEKKRQKKANKSSGDAMEDDDDYDFKVDYVKKGSAMDDGEENEEAGGSNQTRFGCLLKCLWS